MTDDAMLRSMALGRCPYDDGEHDFVRGVCRLCLEERDALIARADRGRLFEMPPRPKRIQRKRTRGWRMPEGAIYVGRPSVYGNPFPIEGEWITGAARSLGYPTGPAFLRGTAVALYRWWLTGEEPIQGIEGTTGYRLEVTEGYNGAAAWLEGHGVIDLPKRPDLAPLRGHDLACWCPVGGWSGDVCATGALLMPCHADVLLELADR